MTSLADVALAFCRECLGWEDADTFTIGRKQRVVRNLSATSGAGNIFNATDLNVVMAAVRKWCDKCDQNLDVYYVPVPTSLWHVSAGPDPVEHPDLCNALLAACVESSRKLKGAA